MCNCTRYAVKRYEKAQKEKRHKGEKPFLEVLIQPKKPNLEHCCEAVFEGDAEIERPVGEKYRPKWETVKHKGGGADWRLSEKSGKSLLEDL